ncbi:chemotaxis protein [Sporosarcina contaminans]|uniref:Chemotaxis protein n=2 Tax=Sporosarcina TaxID=1569 RepID=A0ABW3TXT7_9BACL
MVNDAGDAFQQIAEGVNNVLSQIGDVSRALQDNVQQFDNVAMIVDETYEISTASAAHTQNIAAAAEEQTASMQEISAASDTLAKMAEDLQETIRSFKF